MTNLQTKRLTLKLKTPAETREMLDSMPPEVRKEVSQSWVDRALAESQPNPWIHGFTVILKDSSEAIGFGGFKGPPAVLGEVELAYAIDDAFQNRGFATEVAKALTDYALTQPGVRKVIAHTLPTQGPSPVVLTKCGFQNTGDHMDPDDGRVWRWEYQSPSIAELEIHDPN